ncbi:MAG: YebC/PmpR family DNA-binding transcriptional regulator [Bacillota bacterium]
MSGHSKWANIKHHKAKIDAKKGKIFTKLGRELIMAVKQGGPDPEANSRLKLAVQKAREANMPNDNIKRAIQRGSSGPGTDDYEEIMYEGYGPYGVAILMRILTDNRNRTAGEIRFAFSRNGGNLGETGCVAWMFERKGLLTINLEETKIDSEDIMLMAIEAGAEDFNIEDESIEITTAPDELQQIKDTLTKKGLIFTSSDITMIPQNTITLTGLEEAQQVLKLMELLEDHDDVQDVFANFDLPEELMEQINT